MRWLVYFRNKKSKLRYYYSNENVKMSLDLSMNIDRIKAKDLSNEYFYKNYFVPQKPLLIEGLAYEQPAGDKWNIQFFKQKYGDLMIDVFDNRNKENLKNSC